MSSNRIKRREKMSRIKTKTINLPATPYKKKIGKNEIVYYRRNPFLVDWEIKWQDKGFTVAKANYAYCVNDDGELEIELENGKIVSVRPVEKTDFAKIFAEKIGAIDGLSKTAIKVLLCILAILPEQAMGKDIIKFSYLDYESVAKKRDMKPLVKRNFKKGLNELISKNFLARTDSNDVYYINPTKFFAGNRLTFIDIYITRHEYEMLVNQIKMKQKELESFPIPENE